MKVQTIKYILAGFVVLMIAAVWFSTKSYIQSQLAKERAIEYAEKVEEANRVIEEINDSLRIVRENLETKNDSLVRLIEAIEYFGYKTEEDQNIKETVDSLLQSYVDGDFRTFLVNYKVEVIYLAETTDLSLLVLRGLRSLGYQNVDRQPVKEIESDFRYSIVVTNNIEKQISGELKSDLEGLLPDEFPIDVRIDNMDNTPNKIAIFLKE